MAQRTADAYSLWVRHFLGYRAVARGGWTPPEQIGTADVEAFLNHLVGERRLSASSQNQALNALVFLYRHVLENAMPQDHLGKFVLLRGAGGGGTPAGGRGGRASAILGVRTAEL